MSINLAGKIKVMLAVSEMVPFAKTGGLADVAGALPKALEKLGCEVKIVMPQYRCIDRDKFGLKDAGKLEAGGRLSRAVLSGTGIEVFFVKNDKYYDRDELYGTSSGDYFDNGERFVYFSRMVLNVIRNVKFKPDVLHINDWQTGLIPVYLFLNKRFDSMYKKIATVHTIHNIAYQGIFPKTLMNLAGLPWALFTPDKLEYWDQMNFMKAGIVFSDVVNAVSKKYAEEIQESFDFGWGLEGVLRDKKADLYGIVNGVDYSEWNPGIDKNLPFVYGPEDLEKKEEIKKSMLKMCGLDYKPGTPVVALISRLAGQKGFDILSDAINDIMKLNVQIIQLGEGETKYIEMLNWFKSAYPSKISVNLKFDNKLAHNIYAGADMFLMPSRYEPCGLGQLISFKYGTVPVVRATGGLYDTVKNYNMKTGGGSGFTFSAYTPVGLITALKNAITVYGKKAEWDKLKTNIMKLDYSWDKSAGEYIELYKKAIEKQKNR